MNKHMNILVIEDDNAFRNTLLKALNKEGYSSDGAVDGDQALKLARKKKYDIIISDVRLPGGMDGVEVVRNIKEIYHDQTLVIIITGYADVDAPIRAIKVKVDDYLSKPFELADFLKIVNSNVEKIQQARGKKKLIEEKAKFIIAKHFKSNPEKINLEMSFVKDFGADMLDSVGLIMAVEEEFNIDIDDSEAEKILQVKDLVNHVFEAISEDNI